MRARIGLTSRGVGGPYVVVIDSALEGVDLQEAPEAGDLQPRHHLLVTVAHELQPPPATVRHAALSVMTNGKAPEISPTLLLPNGQAFISRSLVRVKPTW